MKAALCQFNVTWADPQDNRRRLVPFLDEARGCDLFILPEMFSTGYAISDPSACEKSPCATVEWMKGQAADRNMAVAGSIAVSEDGRYYNRLFFVQPDGQVITYDKHHLFTYSGEHRHFTAGNEKCIVPFRGVRFLLTVCYDLRFPVWLRCTDDYDAIINCAEWPVPRRFAWDTLLRARAIENQCFVLGCNRCGTDPDCEYDGGSALIGPYGQTLAAAQDGEECLISGELDMDGLRHFRGKTSILAEGDRFEIIKR